MSKLGKEGHNGHFRSCLNENNAKIRNRTHLLKFKTGENVKRKKQRTSSRFVLFLEREKQPSL